MEMFKVNSSAALQVAYDNGTLFVQYIEGEWYKYFHVPKNVFEKLCTAESLGKFLNQEIKPKYFCQPCPNPQI